MAGPNDESRHLDGPPVGLDRADIVAALGQVVGNVFSQTRAEDEGISQSPGTKPRLPYIERAEPPDTGQRQTGRAWDQLG